MSSDPGELLSAGTSENCSAAVLGKGFGKSDCHFLECFDAVRGKTRAEHHQVTCPRFRQFGNRASRHMA